MIFYTCAKLQLITKMKTLSELAKKHKTDKYTHKYLGKNYLDFYSDWMSKKRFEVTKFLEIGVRGGASLRMWKDFFPNASIYGIDIDPTCKSHEEDRVKIFIGSQNNKEFLEQVMQEVGEVDMILDDGSHIVKHMIFSFNVLFNSVKKEGLYIIEDLRTTYEECQNQHDVRNIWPGMKYNDPEENLKNRRNDFNLFIQKHFENLDKGVKTPLESVHYYPSTVIFKKSNYE